MSFSINKVVHVIVNFGVGGCEVDTITKITALQDKYVHSAVTLLDKGAMAYALENIGIPVYSAGMRCKADLFRFFRAIWLIKKADADIIHAHMFHGYFVAQMAKLFGAKGKLVYSIHKEGHRAGRVEVFIERIFRSRADLIFAASRQVLVSYRKRRVDGDNMKVFYNCVDERKFVGGDNHLISELDIKPGQFVIGCIGRLVVRDKGQDVLLKALPSILRVYPGLKCIFIGSGRDYSALLHLTKDLKLQDAVFWLGGRTDIKNFLPYIDLLIMPSISEAFGIVAAEAAVCGLPVVASSVGGVPEVVINGKTGVLVEPARPDILAGAIICLLADPRLRNKMGKEAKQNVERFSVSILASKLDSEYRVVLKK